MAAFPGKDLDKPGYLLNLIIAYTLCAPGGVKALGFRNVNSVESDQNGHIRKARPTKCLNFGGNITFQNAIDDRRHIMEHQTGKLLFST